MRGVIKSALGILWMVVWIAALAFIAFREPAIPTYMMGSNPLQQISFGVQ